MTVSLPPGPLFIDVAATALLPDDRDRLTHPLVGGVILFSRNYESMDQLKNLVRAIESVRSPSLLIAVDQEGGRVQRFKHPFTILPPAKVYGTIYDRDPAAGRAASRQAGHVMAAELRDVGIDFSFAPVLDLAGSDSEVIGDRAFHRDPAIVSELARSFIEGMHAGGMKATGKHFPGHGAVREDSHLCVPCDAREWREIYGKDLVPYRALCGMLHGVMTAHVEFPAVDREMPTYSRHWLQTVLRDDIGFRGLVFSDDLSMEGAKVRSDPAERVAAALAAGCDMALMCNRPDAVDAVLDQLDVRVWRTAPESVLALKGTTSDKAGYRDALAAVASLRPEFA